MRLVKAGKVYDTDEAIECFEGQLQSSRGDYAGGKTLYRTHNEELFLVTLDSEGGLVEWHVVDKEVASAWLDSEFAPESAYLAAGIELENA